MFEAFSQFFHYSSPKDLFPYWIYHITMVARIHYIYCVPLYDVGEVPIVISGHIIFLAFPFRQSRFSSKQTLFYLMCGFESLLYITYYIVIGRCIWMCLIGFLVKGCYSINSLWLNYVFIIFHPSQITSLLRQV